MKKQYETALINFLQGKSKTIELDKQMFPVLEIFNEPTSKLEGVNIDQVSELLTDRQRQAFTLYYNGKTMKEIAALMDLKSSSVQSHLERARKALKHLIA